MSPTVAAALAAFAYGGTLGFVFPRVARAWHRFRHAHGLQRGAAGLGVIALAIVVVVCVTVLIDRGRDVSPEFIVIISTVSSWIGAGFPTPSREAQQVMRRRAPQTIGRAGRDEPEF